MSNSNQEENVQENNLPLIGTEGDDYIIGTEHGDIIKGRLGNDTILSLGGDDIISGGAGADIINGGEGNNSLYGFEYVESYPAEAPEWDGFNDSITSGSGNDRILSVGGNTIDAGDGDNYIFEWGNYLTLGFSGNTHNRSSIYDSWGAYYWDLLKTRGTGTQGDYPTISTGSGNDFVAIDIGKNVSLGDGDDALIINSPNSEGSIIYNGGDGVDRLVILRSAMSAIPIPGDEDNVASVDNKYMLDFSKIFGFEELVLTSNFGDSLSYLDLGEYISDENRIEKVLIAPRSQEGGYVVDASKYGEHGIEVATEFPDENAVPINFIGTDGVDKFYGGHGDNSMDGGRGDDVMIGDISPDFFNGGSGDDYFDGGDGIDIAIFSGSSYDYKVTKVTSNTFQVEDVRNGSPDGKDTLVDVNQLRFSDGDQILELGGQDQAPTFTITASESSISEGKAFGINIISTNIEAGTSLYYSLSGIGISGDDFSTGGLTGQENVDADGKILISRFLSNDLITEGTETLEIKLFIDAARTLQVGSTATISVVDSSTTPRSNSRPIGIPIISGNLKVGQILSIDASSISDADNFDGWTPTYEYSWQVANDPAPSYGLLEWETLSTDDATDGDGNLEVTEDLAGKFIRGVVTYLDGYGTNEVIESESELLTGDPIDDSRQLSIADQALQAGKTVEIPILISDALGVEAFDLTLQYDANVFSLPANGLNVIAPGTASGGLSFVVNSDQPGQIVISGSSTSVLSSGEGSIALLNLQVNADAEFGSTVIDLVSAEFNEGAISVSLHDPEITILPPSFQVLNVRELPNGLALQLTEAPDLDVFNLYDGPDASDDQADLSLVDGSGTQVALSAHWDESSRELYLLSGSALAAGDYTLAIDSRADGLVTASSGEFLDGNADGTSGDGYSYAFTRSRSNYSLSIADTARGAGQELSVNGAGNFDPVTGAVLEASKGIPVYLSSAEAVTSLSGTFSFDHQLLEDGQLVKGVDLPEDWIISIDLSGGDGTIGYEASGTTAISGDELELFRFQSVITADAAPASNGGIDNGLYGSSTLIQATIQADELTGVEFEVDAGLIALAYSGDATGNGTLSSLDASRVQRVVVDLDSGFDAYDDLNPTLIGDTTGNGTLSSLDASRIQQQVVDLDVNSFPDVTELLIA